ncbi:MAG: transglutaminase domain-containing protein [Anaerolineaceae bacterium]|nr:transglutaminase domain-containing protein [Anaerolineaceae bacterium]
MPRFPANIDESLALLYTQNMDNAGRRWWDVPSIICLIAALWVLTLRLQATNWTDHLDRIEFVMFLGVALGLILGQSAFSRRTAFWLAVAYSVILVPWQLGLTMDPSIQWSERMFSLLGRLQIAGAVFLRNKPVRDPILFLLCMAVLVWLISLLSGYQMTRNGRPWVPLLIAGLSLIIIDSYNPFLGNRQLYSGAFVLLALFTLGRLYFLHSHQSWRDKGIAVDYDTGYTMGRSVLISGALIVLVSWNVPVFSQIFTSGSPQQEELVQFWKSIQDRLSKAVVGLQSPSVESVDFYSNEMPLGRGTYIGNDLVFSVQTVTTSDSNIRYYWRGISYDFYQDGQWKNTLNEQSLINPAEWPVKYPDWSGRQRVDFIVQYNLPLTRMIYLPDVPDSVSRPVELIGSTNIGATRDVVSLTSDPPLHAGETINVSSLVSDPTEQQLRAAGTDYPSWVTQNYLEVPADLPARDRALARSLVAGQRTPYGEAAAITEYLRKNYTYQTTVPNPPQSQEPLDWFLFDYKKGFCNYYAASEVMLLRSIGIPARLAVGFAQGQSVNPNSKTKVQIGVGLQEFLIHRDDSHAWPEVYFPGLGWIEFEPTASQAARTFPSGEKQGQNPATSLSSANPPGEPLQNRQALDSQGSQFSQKIPISFLRLFQFALGILLLVSVIGLALTYPYNWLRTTMRSRDKTFPTIIEDNLVKRGWKVPGWLKKWAWLAEIAPIERIFISVNWMLKLLGVTVLPAFTPAEQIDTLIKALPGSAEPATILLDEYERAIYSPYPFDLKRARHANQLLWRLTALAWIKHLLPLQIDT